MQPERRPDHLAVAFLHGSVPSRRERTPSYSIIRPSVRGGPHFAPKAKRVIYLFQSGEPSQIEGCFALRIVRAPRGSCLENRLRSRAIRETTSRADLVVGLLLALASS